MNFTQSLRSRGLVRVARETWKLAALLALSRDAAVQCRRRLCAFGATISVRAAKSRAREPARRHVACALGVRYS